MWSSTSTVQRALQVFFTIELTVDAPRQKEKESTLNDKPGATYLKDLIP